jgi:2-aminoadipate transaminase
VANTLNLPAILHRGLLEFLQSGNFASHLEQLRKAYRARRDGLVDALHEHFRESEFCFKTPKGGFFLWGEAPGLKDSDSFVKFAIQSEGVGVIAGKTFSPDPTKTTEDTIRLSFAKVSPEEANEGCKRLKRALSKYIKLIQEGERTNE